MGLAVAYQLAKDGHEPVIYEADDRVGGMTATFDFNGLEIERYYHFHCISDHAFLAMLDELNIALRYDYLPLADVVETLKARRSDLHVVVTGRNAKPELIAAADLVTEMVAVKHHFAAGVKAQEGIEF